MFLERVYGIDDQTIFFRLLEEGFLPDLRAAILLDASSASDSDLALALYRYLGNNVLPLLTTNAHFFNDADHASDLLSSLLHTSYRLSKCRSLTKGQREAVSNFLVAFTNQLRPPMMTKLLRKLTIDVPALTENTIVPLLVLCQHYERCGRYYGSRGWGSQGSATEEEKRLTMTLFSSIFDSLAQRAYDPELFSRALPCLAAIGCALSPDYSLSHQDDSWLQQASLENEDQYNPQPADTQRVVLNPQLETVASHFAEHWHDSWAIKKIEEGWMYGTSYDDDKLSHPNIKPFMMLTHQVQEICLEPIRESVKAMIAWGWGLDHDDTRTGGRHSKRRSSKAAVIDSPHGYQPQPVDLRNVTLTREVLTMAEKLAENAHAVWSKRKQAELATIGGGVHSTLIPWELLTDMERAKDRDRSQELLKFLQTQGYRIQCHNLGLDRKREIGSHQSKDSEADSGVGVSSTEKRFAYSLLEKLLEYLERAAQNLNQTKPSTRFSRRGSYTTATEDVKFFGKVVLPLVEKYFRAHMAYFVTSSLTPASAGGSASVKEKEMTCMLFCRLAALLRQKITAFGHDVNISVRCLQVLVQAIDARSVVKNSPEIIRASILPFVNNAADDLTQTVFNLKKGRFSHVKGTITRGASSLNYVHMVLLPVLTSLFDQLGRNNHGPDILVEEIQMACYRILNALYTLGTSGSLFVKREAISSELDRHRPALGECVAAFSSTFPVAFLEPELNRFNKYSMVYGIEGKIEDFSLEAREVMEQLAENVPTLEKIIEEIEDLAESGGKYDEAPHVIEVTLPMLCSYLPLWWAQGPDNVTLSDESESNHVTSVTANLMNNVLGNVLKLIKNNIGTPNAPWMTRIATRTQPIIGSSTPDMLQDHILPVAQKLRDKAIGVEKEEEEYNTLKRSNQDVADFEVDVQTHFQTLVRDIYAFYPLLIKYVDLHRSHWLKNPEVAAESLYSAVAEIFYLWSKSNLFKREETNFVTQHEIDNMALIMPTQAKGLGVTSSDDSHEAPRQKGRKREKKKMEIYSSLNVACLKRLLPIGLTLFGGREQELVQQAKQKMIESLHYADPEEFVSSEPEAEIEEFLTRCLQTEEKLDEDAEKRWQKLLYKKIGKTKLEGDVQLTQVQTIERVMAMARVLHGLYLVDHPHPSLKGAWRKLISSQKKRAVMACFRMVPLHNLPRHRVVNLFLKSYKIQWLAEEESDVCAMIEDLTSTEESEEKQEKKDEVVEEKPDPLKQLITAFARAATTETCLPAEDFLYTSYADIMSKSCEGEDEDDDDDEAEEGGASLQEQEMEKLKLLYEQSRLSDRGASEMALLYISASRGEPTALVVMSIELGISLLRGGNTKVQKLMLEHLQEKKDVGFFTSIAGLLQQCSVLDLDAFERCNKAEGLGMGSDGTGAGVKNLHDAEFTCKIFRFLQLLCEGHNLDFQNYLRTQAGNNTTVNIIICTVDYLLRLQESIMDFYWHYSGKDTIDPSGKENFCRAIMVAKQVFRTLTEDIQGPCSQNQMALAHSRLWDAVGGFLYIFAHMQDKLSKDPLQLELLREFMKLQKEMMIMLLSMLEGNVMNGAIGKQMLDTLVESSANMDMILKFFDIFLKMKDLTTSEAFLEFDTNKDGFISAKEFRRAMEAQKMYSGEEIDYIMMCVDANQDGKVDFAEFTDRFHNPAKDIGFNVALLLTNLSEHMPNDPRLERFLEKARSVLDYFEPYLGRIEIMGSAGRIERVYFEIKQSHIDQWEKPQIKDSKRSFLHSVVNEGGDKEKLESFVNFCEDTIFEMQHATSISVEEQSAYSQQLAALRSSEGGEGGSMGFAKAAVTGIKDGIFYLLSFLTWTNIKNCYTACRGMTLGEFLLTTLKLQLQFGVFFMTVGFNVVWTFFKFILAMMMGDRTDRPVHDVRRMSLPPAAILSAEQQLALQALEKSELSALEEPPSRPMHAFGVDIVKDENADGTSYRMQAARPNNVSPQSSTEYSEGEGSMDVGNGEMAPTMESTEPHAIAGAPQDTTDYSTSREPMSATSPEDPYSEGTEGEETENFLPSKEDSLDTGKWILSLFARHFYNLKLAALVLAFFINFMLLFFRVTSGEEGGEAEGDDGAEAVVNATINGEGNGDEEEPMEYIIMSEKFSYFDPTIRILALLHSIVSFSMMVAYYCLKVPLVIFKREKETSRMLEFDGLWITQQPEDDDLRGHWDKLVIGTKSFPEMYWDKFIKKKVRNKYSEQYDYDEISNLLGMDKGDNLSFKDKEEKVEEPKGFLSTFLTEVDYQHQIWKWGVIFTDNSFLYIVLYFVFSLLGNVNYFFFAAHLLDVAISFKTLRTIMQSVTHNGKQLVLTVMLTSVVVYIYTVIAFNFFRKFYIKDEDGQIDAKCHDMLTCFIFHLYAGVRAGGGIGDEIEPPDGDDYENYRRIFDITFFFFVIVILLAIIQGLIIDAFGELRDQLEQVKEDMESKCFICGIGKEYFDKVPHGFEKHVQNEHNFANYMFFLMHLINKPDTEYTGQETYVWELYQQRCWDFFPVGDCFRKQYDDEPAAS